MRTAILAGAVAALIGASTGAAATPILQDFYATGMTDSFSQQARASFSIDPSNLGTISVTLTDNVNPTGNIVSVLAGISFSFSQPVTSVGSLSVSPTSIVDCTASSTTSCPPPNPLPAEPYGWSATVSGGVVTLAAPYNPGSALPYGIVNANYNGTDLSDALNNPLLVGPVTFTFSTDLQSFPEITGVSFLFGTRPVTIAAVPEPQSLALLGIALVAGWVVRSRAGGKPSRIAA